MSIQSGGPRFEPLVDHTIETTQDGTSQLTTTHDPRELQQTIREQGTDKANKKSFFENLREKANVTSVLSSIKNGLLGAVSLPRLAGKLPNIKKEDALNVLKNIGKAVGKALEPLKNLLPNAKSEGVNQDTLHTQLPLFKEEVRSAINKDPATFLRGTLKSTPAYGELLGMLGKAVEKHDIGKVALKNMDKGPEAVLEAVVSKLEEASKKDPDLKAIGSALRDGVNEAVGKEGSSVKNAGQFVAAAFVLRILISQVPTDRQAEFSKNIYVSLQGAANQYSRGEADASTKQTMLFDRLATLLTEDTPGQVDNKKSADVEKASAPRAEGKKVSQEAVINYVKEGRGKMPPTSFSTLFSEISKNQELKEALSEYCKNNYMDVNSDFLEAYFAWQEHPTPEGATEILNKFFNPDSAKEQINYQQPTKTYNTLKDKVNDNETIARGLKRQMEGVAQMLGEQIALKL